MSTVGRTVLLIEDNDDAREAVAALLEHEGCVVETAAECDSGIELVWTQRPDVVLIIFGLLGINGYEVARRIRALGSPQPYMVSLTGYGRQEDRDRAVEAGFDSHLVKLVDPNALATLVTRGTPD